jgi:pimeloyl-ACP methyl ester carboxylesterase
VQCPVHLAWPRTDPIGGEGVARRFAADLPDAHLDVWGEGSHAPWIDDPERAARFVTEAIGHS